MCGFFFIFLVCFFRNSTLINIIVSYICYLFVGSVLLIYMFTEHHSLYLAFSSVPGPIPKTCSLFCVLLLLLPPPCLFFVFVLCFFFFLINQANDISNTHALECFFFFSKEKFFPKENIFCLLILGDQDDAEDCREVKTCFV